MTESLVSWSLFGLCCWSEDDFFGSQVSVWFIYTSVCLFPLFSSYIVNNLLLDCPRYSSTEKCTSQLFFVILLLSFSLLLLMFLAFLGTSHDKGMPTEDRISEHISLYNEIILSSYVFVCLSVLTVFLGYAIKCLIV